MIKITRFEWEEARGDWLVEYDDSRQGLERGMRYLPLPKEATESDAIKYIESE